MIKEKIKFFIIIFFSLFAFANANSKNNLIIVPDKFYLASKYSISDFYNKYLAYQETNALYKALNKVLRNKKLKNRFYLEEIGKTKVNTFALIQQLTYFLNGWPKYTNTYFNNNSDIAGIRKILKDCLQNDSKLQLNIPLSIINQIKKNVDTLKIFTEINALPNFDNPKIFLEKLSQIIDNYSANLINANCPILKKINKDIQEQLERNYRIYAKTSLDKTIKIFKKLIKKNYQNLED